MEKKVVVIIPVHKAKPSTDDKVALQACKNVLKAYDRFLVFPDGTDISEYEEYGFKQCPVDKSWLSSIENYNRMKFDQAFYRLFDSYEYMVTYEPDAYIFNENFEAYEVFRYDYIGAPFFEGYLEATDISPFIKGGNSGLSVRNIATCINVLESMEKYRWQFNLYKSLFSNNRRFQFWFNKLTFRKAEILVYGQFNFFFTKQYMNEDLVWSQIVPRLFPKFKVADPTTALKFSFEAQPQRLLALNGGQLPMGCHGWPKNKPFWKPYIPFDK